MTTASPPRCSTSVRRAYSLTAIRALIFSSAGCRIGYAAIIARERGFEVWNVATIGPCAAQQASSAERGRGRLVDVDHVEVAVVQPAAHPGGGQEAEVQPGHRAVVRHRHGAPGGDDVRRQRGVVVGRGEHGHLVAERG